MTSATLAASVFNVAVKRDGDAFEAIYNTATGNYLVLDDRLRALYGAIRSGDVLAEDGDILHQAGFAVDRQIDEVESVGIAFNTARQNKYAPHLTITPTMDCNFGCDYCFETHVKGMMSVAVQDRLVAFADGLCESAGPSPALSVTWFGGEPLMGLAVIERLSAMFQERERSGAIGAYKANIITNGYGLSVKTCAMLDHCGVSHVQITLDGPAEVHDSRRFLKRSRGGTFAKIVANIRHIPASMAVLVRMNVDRSNQDRFEDLYRELDAEGLLDRIQVDLAHVENFSRQPTSATVLTAREFAQFKSHAIAVCARNGWPIAHAAPTPSLTGVCQVDSTNAFVVSAKGELYKCWAELENDGRCIGRLDDPAGWPRLAKSPLSERDPLDDSECRACALLPTCMGSCPKVRDLNRNFHGKQCPPFKYMFDELVYRQFGPDTNIRKLLY
ncbi:MAG: radical SAM protein [Sphingobium limneticum]